MLSIPITRYPIFKRVSARCAPIKPATPATKTVFSVLTSFLCEGWPARVGQCIQNNYASQERFVNEVELRYDSRMKKEPISNDGCLICERIWRIKQGKSPHFVAELETGYVVIGDHQFFRGYTLFLCKRHKRELHKLSPAFRQRHLWEMSQVAEAVYRAFHPKKLNYELLGNTDSHIHWHIFPRHSNDPLPRRTVWNIPKEVRQANAAKPSDGLLQQLRKSLKLHLSRVLKKSPTIH